MDRQPHIDHSGCTLAFKIVIIEHAHHIGASATAQGAILTLRNIVVNGRVVERDWHAFVDKFKLGHEDLLVLYNHTYCESFNFSYITSITNKEAINQRTRLVGIERLLDFINRKL